MWWNDKRYHTLNYELKKTFGDKVIKLSLDGGFTCPNRDGSIGSRGCIFCGEKGSGEFAGLRSQSISEQIHQQQKLLARKWPTGKYIAYFQNYTNTYAPISTLRQLYDTALMHEGVVGLAVATRPDCLPSMVMDLLEEYSRTTYLWVELGLQTIHQASADFIRRGYPLSCFTEAITQLKHRNIRTVVHLILGLPGENRENILESVRFIAKLGVWGVKLHMLFVQKDTDLYQHYCNNPFPLMTREEYVKIAVDALEILPAETVIHRITGDGDRKLLFAPLWTLDKRRVLADIDRELAVRNSFQGMKNNPARI